jgi:hypothetical protein
MEKQSRRLFEKCGNAYNLGIDDCFFAFESQIPCNSRKRSTYEITENVVVDVLGFFAALGEDCPCAYFR